MKLTILTICMALLAVNPLLAADQPSADRGRELFKSETLGTNGKSCASCHPSGEGLERAASYPDGKLEKIANQCITMALKGESLPAGSTELTSLVMYLKTLAPAKVP